ncbi:MAG: hypothetical protein AAGG02_14010 [Cyanobacteria bacterium P01_H01_bin.15]
MHTFITAILVTAAVALSNAQGILNRHKPYLEMEITSVLSEVRPWQNGIINTSTLV